MSALSTAAILGLAAATAGTQVASAAIQNHAAGKAVDAQTKASNQALQVGQGVYNDQKAAAQPYQQIGQMALGRLGAMPQNTAVFDPTKPAGPLGASPAGGQMPQQPMAPQAPQMMPQQEPMVHIQAPDGTVRPIPQSKVQLALSRGGKLVQGAGGSAGSGSPQAF